MLFSRANRPHMPLCMAMGRIALLGCVETALRAQATQPKYGIGKCEPESPSIGRRDQMHFGGCTSFAPVRKNDLVPTCTVVPGCPGGKAIARKRYRRTWLVLLLGLGKFRLSGLGTFLLAQHAGICPLPLAGFDICPYLRKYDFRLLEHIHFLPRNPVPGASSCSGPHVLPTALSHVWRFPVHE